MKGRAIKIPPFFTLTIMKLKKTEHYTKIYKLINAKLLTVSDYEALRDTAKAIDLPKRIMNYTLDEYFGLMNAAKGGDAAIIEYIFKDNKKSLKKLDCYNYFAYIRAVNEQVKEVAEQFQSIKQPPLSAEAQQAGFGLLNFGDFGLLDYIAKRQMLTDEEAAKTLLGFAILKLKNDAMVAMCNYRMNEIIKLKYQR